MRDRDDSAVDPVRSALFSAGAHTSWARTADRTARTQPGRDKFERRFDLEVDPDGVLDPADRARRAAHARTAYFKRMAASSALKRRQARQARLS